MKELFLLTFIIFVARQTCFGQFEELTITNRIFHTEFKVEGKHLSKRETGRFLETRSPEAFKKFSESRNTEIAAYMLGGVGVAVICLPFAWEGGYTVGTNTFVGLGIASGAILLDRLSARGYQKTLKIYNDNKSKERIDLNFGITQNNNMGLFIRF